MAQVERSGAPSTLPAPPFSRGEILRVMGAALVLYLGASVLAVVALSVTVDEPSGPMVAVAATFGQLGLLLPPLVALSRWGSLIRILGLDRLRLGDLGALVGYLVAAFIVMVPYGLLLERYEIVPQQPVVPLFGTDPLDLAGLLILTVVVAPLIEEIVFRGFLFGALSDRMSVTGAALISGIVFGLFHLQPFAFPVLAALGVLLALLYRRTRTLWAPILMHMVINSLGIGAQIFEALPPF